MALWLGSRNSVAVEYFLYAFEGQLVDQRLVFAGILDASPLDDADVLMWTLGEMMYASMANAYLGGLAPPALIGRYQGLYGAAFTTGTSLSPLIGGAVFAHSQWMLWALVGVAGLLSAQLCLPGKNTATTAQVPAST